MAPLLAILRLFCTVGANTVPFILNGAEVNGVATLRTSPRPACFPWVCVLLAHRWLPSFTNTV